MINKVGSHFPSGPINLDADNITSGNPTPQTHDDQLRSSIELVEPRRFPVEFTRSGLGLKKRQDRSVSCLTSREVSYVVQTKITAGHVVN